MQGLRRTATQRRCASCARRSLGLVALLAAFGAIWTASGGAAGRSTKAALKTFVVVRKAKLFVPKWLTLRAGDTVRFCNHDPFLNEEFSLSPYNKFGNSGARAHGRLSQPYQYPGACSSVVIHNPTGSPISVRVFDEIHSAAKLTLTVLPRSAPEPAVQPFFAGTWSTFGGRGRLGLQVVDAAKGAKAVAVYSDGAAICGSETVYYTGYYNGSSDSGQVAGCTTRSGRHLMAWYKSGAGPQRGTFSVDISANSATFSGTYEELSDQKGGGAYNGLRLN
jgi:hypothetical protein